MDNMKQIGYARSIDDVIFGRDVTKLLKWQFRHYPIVENGYSFKTVNDVTKGSVGYY
jgi:hypothetical protein